jgi:hypothetical protein
VVVAVLRSRKSGSAPVGSQFCSPVRASAGNTRPLQQNCHLDRSVVEGPAILSRVLTTLFSPVLLPKRIRCWVPLKNVRRRADRTSLCQSSEKSDGRTACEIEAQVKP